MDVNIIIPIGFDSTDRIKNFEISFNYLKNTFPNWKKTLVAQNFNSDPNLKLFLEEISDSNTNIIIIDKELPFRQILLYNQVASICNEDILIFYDLDCLIEKDQLLEAVEKIKNGYDLVFPYSNPIYYVDNKDKIELNHLRKISRLFTSPHNWKETGHPDIAYAPGFISIIKRKSWIDSGMENENYYGWGVDDVERICKFIRLGYKCTRIYGDIFHLEHSRNIQSYFYDTGEKNQKLFNSIHSLNDDDFKKYYENQKQINLKKYNLI